MVEAAVFRIVPDTEKARRAAEVLFEKVRLDLAAILPATAIIQHVGATAVPECLTKGDLDVVVRVDRQDFACCDKRLATLFSRNTSSVRTEDFAAFEDCRRSPHLGIQLTVWGCSFDVFHLFAEVLFEDRGLVQRYNALKVRFEGKPAPAYRSAKDAFIREALRNAGH